MNSNFYLSSLIITLGFTTAIYAAQSLSEIATVSGKGFGGNHRIGEYEFGRDYPFLKITRDQDTEQCFMENPGVKVVDMAHNYDSDNKPMEFTCKKTSDQSGEVYFTGYFADGYDRVNGAASPTNDALYIGEVIIHMYRDWYGLEVLTERSAPMQLIMRVHYGDYGGTAMWDGFQMNFGDGDSSTYPLASLDVGAHEISHGFTEQRSGLYYVGQSGAINESFSDMAAQAAEYYSRGSNTWKFGADVMKEDSGYDALRYMDKPSRDGISIDSASDYYEGMDMHYASGVYNHFFYILANQPNWDTRKAFDVMVKANVDYWTPGSTFIEAGCGIISAARDLGYSLDDIKKSLSAVEVDYQSCVQGF